MPDSDKDTINFLRERESRLGSPITYRTYSLFYGSSKGESRQYGVFLYTDGETFIFEDFEHKPSLLGIEIRKKEESGYVKLERSFRREDVVSINTVTRTSGVDGISTGLRGKPVGGLMAKLRKTLQEVILSDGTIYWFELMEPEKFFNLFTRTKIGE